MTTPEYNVSQPALYMICRILLDNCRANLSTFTANKAMYNDAWCDARATQIDAASQLPDDQSRSYQHEQLRLQLVEKGNACCEMFQYAKSYIRTAYSTPDERQVNWNAAGLSYYDAASRQNWTAVDALTRTCINYLTDNFTALNMSGQNMPQQFINDFILARDKWSTLYFEFTNARQTARTGRQSKVMANNKLYRILMDTICSDGQLYFRADEEMRRQFSFEAISELVTPSGASAAVITVVNADTAQPLLAEVTEETSDRTLTTDGDGRCEFGNLSSGTKVFTITVDGYQPQPISLNLKTGTTSRATVEMVPLFIGSGNKSTSSAKPEMAIVSNNGQAADHPSAFN